MHFQIIFFNTVSRVLINISLKFAPEGQMILIQHLFMQPCGTEKFIGTPSG